MTYREFLNAVVAGNVSADVVDFANAELVKITTKNDNRKANAKAKTAEANAPIIADIQAILTDSPMTASQVAVAVGVSVQKASAILQNLAKNGDVSVVVVKANGKKVNGYKTITSDNEEGGDA